MRGLPANLKRAQGIPLSGEEGGCVQLELDYGHENLSGENVWDFMIAAWFGVEMELTNTIWNQLEAPTAGISEMKH